MWFYKIDGVLDGFTFPEDRRIRSQAAQEFQPKQTLFSKKLQGKCYVTVSQIKSQKITLAAVSRESYNVLARSPWTTSWVSSTKVIVPRFS